MKKFVACAFVLLICLAQWINSAPVDHSVAELEETIPGLPADTMQRFKRSDVDKITENGEDGEAISTYNENKCCRLQLWYCCDIY